jgi:hypothetical protein
VVMDSATEDAGRRVGRARGQTQQLDCEWKMRIIWLSCPWVVPLRDCC